MDGRGSAAPVSQLSESAVGQPIDEMDISTHNTEARQYDDSSSQMSKSGESDFTSAEDKTENIQPGTPQVLPSTPGSAEPATSDVIPSPIDVTLRNDVIPESPETQSLDEMLSNERIFNRRRTSRTGGMPMSLSNLETARVSESSEEMSPAPRSAPYDSSSPRGSPLSRFQPDPRRRSAPLSKRRKSAQLLEPLVIPDTTMRLISINENKDLDYRDAQTAQIGMQILAHFLLENLPAFGFVKEEIKENLVTLSLVSKTGLNENLRSKLEKLAKKFEETPQRHMISFRANKTDLKSLTQREYDEILNSLFQNNQISVERFLVMLFFCLDLSVRSLRDSNKLDFMNFIDWSASYIKNRLSIVVFSVGGWNNVLVDRRDWYVNLGVGLATVAMVVGFCALVSSGKKSDLVV